MFLKFNVDKDTKVLVSHRHGFDTPNLRDVLHRGDIDSFNKYRQKLASGDFWLTLLKEGAGLNVTIPVQFENHQMRFPADLPKTTVIDE